MTPSKAREAANHGILPEIAHLARPVDELSGYPGNPRRGDVALISESLAVNGQFRPIIIRRGTNEVLAGNHTWRAARSLGWTHVAAVEVEVDDEMAARVVIADNRHSDLATYDEFALADLLEQLPALEGTGFDDEDLRRLKSRLEATALFADAPTAPVTAGDATGVSEEGAAKPGIAARTGRVVIADANYLVELDDFMDWVGGVVDDAEQAGEGVQPIEIVLRRLGLDHAIAGSRSARTRPTVVGKPLPTTRAAIVDGELVSVDSLVEYGLNARNGDVGAIAESLAANGQFRPIVVRKGTNEVLAGNHTWRAARSLGWDEIAVTWVDVDDEAAVRIALVDNRASDFGWTDSEDLARLINKAGALDGLGYEASDLDEMFAGVAEWRPDGFEFKTKSERTAVTILISGGEVRWSEAVNNELFLVWREEQLRSARYSHRLLRSRTMERLGFPEHVHSPAEPPEEEAADEEETTDEKGEA